MAEERDTRLSAEGGPIAQALGTGATATVVAIDYSHVRPVTVDDDVLRDVQGLLADLPLDSVPKPSGPPAGSKAPPMPPNRLLAGRDEDLKHLAARVKDDANGPPAVVVSGIGGVGKTQLAAEFAHRYSRFFAGGVYWLNLSDSASIKEEVARCGGAGAMDLRGDFNALPLDERVGAVMSEWHSDLPRLIVLDDCVDGRTLQAARPRSGGCRVLATSRGPITDLALGVAPLALEPLGREASVELLRGYCEGTGARDEDLDKIADELGDLPLALDLAGRYLRRYRHGTDAARYLRELQSDEVLGHRSLRESDERENSPTGHDMNVGRTFVVSYRGLEGGGPIDRMAIRLLARAARFAPGKPIDRRLLLSTLGSAEEELTAREVEDREDALGLLVELGLITESETGPVSMHKLVAASARREVEDPEAQSDMERAVATEAVEVVKSGQPVRLEPLMPHLRHGVEAAGDRDDDEPAYLVRFAMGHALGALGRPAEAVPYLRSAIEYNAALLRDANGLTGEEGDRLFWLVMRQRDDVTVMLERAGDAEGALAVHKSLLEDRRNNLPQPHEDVASTLLNIGMLKAEQGVFHEVGPMYEEALGIREEVLALKDQDDPERKQLLRDVAESHGNLGAFCMDLGRVREATSSYRRSLDVYEDLDETEHERYANTTMGYGAALGLLGDFGGARDRLELALLVNRRVMPEGSTRIVKNLILLSALLAVEAGRVGSSTATEKREILDTARGHLEEVLDPLRRLWGEGAPLTAGVMRVAANVAEAEGRHADASPLRARADAARGNVLRNADADFVAKGVEIFAARGLYGEAELYGWRALDLRRFVAPKGSFKVAEAEFALGRLLQLRGRRLDAAEHLKEALNLREALLGEGHPATELVRDCLSYAGGRQTRRGVPWGPNPVKWPI